MTEPTCRDCGKHHETFRDGVACDVNLYGPKVALTRLSKFMDDDKAAALIDDITQSHRVLNVD